MGEVKVFIELENAADRVNAIDNLISKDKIRQYGTEGLVDTGAVMLMLPQDIVEVLGLKIIRTAIVTYADDRKEEVKVASPVTIRIKDRFMTTDCLVGKPLSEPLIGQVVLETLDLIVDCTKRTLTPRPESPIYPLLKCKILRNKII